MSYFFAGKPLDIKNDKVIASEEANEANEANGVPTTRSSPQATHANVAAALAAISRTSRPNIVGRDISKRPATLAEWYFK